MIFIGVLGRMVILDVVGFIGRVEESLGACVYRRVSGKFFYFRRYKVVGLFFFVV